MSYQYDSIILGSGLGGLLCGALMAKHGMKVLVLEKNYQYGGSLQSYNRKGYNFSTGLHYLGGLDKGQPLHKIFSYFGLLDDIAYQRLDDACFDVFNIGGYEYEFPIGWDSFRKKMIDYFPDEEVAIDNYIEEIHKVIDLQEVNLLHANGNNEININEYHTINTWEFIQSLTTNKKLQQVLSALNFVYGGVKSKSPLYVHALINNHYISSAYRIVGRSSQISEKLVSQIIANGGKVITNSAVIGIDTADDLVKSVKTINGDVFTAKNFISNVHPSTTMSLIPDGGIKKSFRNRMNRKENTLSAFAINLVLKDNCFKYRNHNYNYYKGDDVWYASNYNSVTWPEHYFMHYSVPHDGGKYAKCIGLLTHMEFEEVAKWKDLDSKKRGADYKEFKEDKAKKLIELASKQFPELKESIDSYYISTPLTYLDYLGSPKGSMYGTLRDHKNPLGSYIHTKTKLDNLFFTGQNLNLHGVLGVSLSAIITCGEFFGTANLIKEINLDET
ncbi:MAG: NAD(P)-binding protein [Bacteroidales bacterium]|nr:NAD(P)-binding protein [Bacteroidales bacterium]MDG2080550.1 NAD(P)-binding protein [Bacteroidales bacterium]